MSDADEAPRLVPAGESSRTVLYKGRYLYSKYSPRRAIIGAVERLRLLPGTLVLAHSPCLCYGMQELLDKLPAECLVVAVEADASLLALAEQAIRPLQAQQPPGTLRLFSAADAPALDSFLRHAVETGRYRRAVAIDFSAGAALASAQYQAITSAAQDIISVFWKNRITLVKMGRLYSRNLFRNIARLESEPQLADVRATVGKPILVCGAGESLDDLLSPRNKTLREQLLAGKVCVIAVDAALPALRARHIPVDAVVGVEAQFAIQAAYTGARNAGRNEGIILFADLCSRPQIPQILGGRTVWFASEYAPSRFLARMEQEGVIEGFIPPLGSVGLTATHIALALRQNEDVPVYITGLDFSYSMGKTHAAATPAHTVRLLQTDRLTPIANYGAAFAPGCAPVSGKDGTTIYTSTVLNIYAHTFARHFCGQRNLFTLAPHGLDLRLPRCSPSHLAEASAAMQPEKQAPGAASPQYKRSTHCVATFCAAEREALRQITDLLRLGEAAPCRRSGQSLTEQLRELLLPREYLYLHFPDGYRLSMEPNFLKRIRAETDGFLKSLSCLPAL